MLLRALQLQENQLETEPLEDEGEILELEATSWEDSEIEEEEEEGEVEGIGIQ